MASMDVRHLTNTEDLKRYEDWIASQPEASLWQSLEWKRYQEALGRETRIYALMEGRQILASALVIIDRTAFGFSTWDIPHGPLIHEEVESPSTALGTGGKWKAENTCEALLERITEDAQKDRCLSIYLSPAKSLTTYHLPLTLFPSGRHEQPSATRFIDLTLSEEEILAQMKPKGRYNISVSEKHGIRVEESKDVDTFYALLKETGGRDQFGIKPKKHYEAFLNNLPNSFLFLASPEERSTYHLPLTTYHTPIAGLLGVIWGKIGIYYYGASSYEQRALMAPYALQWAAMKQCKARGCDSYDLLGIAPPDAPENHPWSGVSAFKEKFGGQVTTCPPEQQIILRPMAYRLLQLKRKIIG